MTTIVMNPDRRQFNGRTPQGTPTAERFWSKVLGGDFEHCWLWMAGKDPKGYGMFYVAAGQMVRAHRWAYEDLRAEIPAGLVIDHLCRTPACVNPWHLEPVTDRINVLRGFGPGARALRRSECLRGHRYAETGVIRSGRRVCRECLLRYQEEYHKLTFQEVMRRKELGIPVVDLDAVFAQPVAS